jgi:hypothetical protein
MKISDTYMFISWQKIFITFAIINYIIKIYFMKDLQIFFGIAMIAVTVLVAQNVS